MHPNFLDERYYRARFEREDLFLSSSPHDLERVANADQVLVRELETRLELAGWRWCRRAAPPSERDDEHQEFCLCH